MERNRWARAKITVHPSIQHVGCRRRFPWRRHKNGVVPMTIFVNTKIQQSPVIERNRLCLDHLVGPVTTQKPRYYLYLFYAGWPKLGIYLIEMSFKTPVWWYFMRRKGSRILNSRYKHTEGVVEDKTESIQIAWWRGQAKDFAYSGEDSSAMIVGWVTGLSGYIQWWNK